MTRRRAAAALLLIALVVVTIACRGKTSATPSSATTPSATQKDDGAGSVTLEVTWATPEYIADDEKLRAVAEDFAADDVVLLHVKMNTHSVDLSKYDLANLSTLDAGNGQEPAIDSATISDDQHHAEAVLVFKRPAKAATATLVVREVGGVPERTLRWSPPPG